MRAPNGDLTPVANWKGVVDGSTTHKFRDGKVAMANTFWDMAGLLMQLKWVPQ